MPTEYLYLDWIHHTSIIIIIIIVILFAQVLRTKHTM